MFPGSTVTKGFKCGHTKATEIKLLHSMLKDITSAVSESGYILQFSHRRDNRHISNAKNGHYAHIFDNSCGSFHCVFSSWRAL